ncbi:MAG: nucleoid-associated protein [Chryseolinea sp.]
MMIDTSKTVIHSLSVHGVGNQTNSGVLKLTDTPLALDNPLLTSLLLTYFFSGFRIPEYYSFVDDAASYPVYQAVKSIFHDDTSLHQNSVALATRLYEITQHPNIKSGELYTAYFTGIGIEGKVYNAVGLFKSESKERFLKLNEFVKRYDIVPEEGININRLDKGCLILEDYQGEDALTDEERINISEGSGYKALILDNVSRSDAQFWKVDFLGLQPKSDAFHKTHDFMNLTRQYVGDQLDEEFSVSKADKIDLLNRSMDFFKSRDQFNQNEFEKQVLGDESVIESFRNFERSLTPEGDRSGNFEISAQAVKRQARVFKSVLKLDKNFHIYIHGNRELIEKGYDANTKRHFYKIYFEEES